MDRLQSRIQSLKDEQWTAYKSLRPGSSHIKALENISVTPEGTPSLSTDKIIWVVFNSSPQSSFTVDQIVEQLEKAFPEWSHTQDRQPFKVSGQVDPTGRSFLSMIYFHVADYPR